VPPLPPEAVHAIDTVADAELEVPNEISVGALTGSTLLVTVKVSLVA
jgi:hypothetical protein